MVDNRAAVRKLMVTAGIMLICVLLTSCISIPTGDGGSLKLSKDGIQVKDGDGTEIKIDSKDGTLNLRGTDADGKETVIQFDTEEGKMTIESDGEQAEATFNFAGFGDVEIPEEFPADIPIADGAIMSSSSKMEDGTEAVLYVSYAVEGGSYADIAAMYEQYMDKQNYQDVMDMSWEGVFSKQGIMQNGGGFSVMVNDDGDMIHVHLIYVSK